MQLNLGTSTLLKFKAGSPKVTRQKADESKKCKSTRKFAEIRHIVKMTDESACPLPAKFKKRLYPKIELHFCWS